MQLVELSGFLRCWKQYVACKCSLKQLRLLTFRGRQQTYNCDTSTNVHRLTSVVLNLELQKIFLWEVRCENVLSSYKIRENCLRAKNIMVKIILVDKVFILPKIWS